MVVVTEHALLDNMLDAVTQCSLIYDNGCTQSPIYPCGLKWHTPSLLRFCLQHNQQMVVCSVFMILLVSLQHINMNVRKPINPYLLLYSFTVFPPKIRKKVP